MQEGATPPDAIRERVAAFVAEARARQGLLIDLSGHVLAAAGAELRDDAALGALLAGIFGSAQALARLFGEDAFQAFFGQGAELGIYTVRIGARWLLVTAFDRQTQVGLVRMLAAQAAADLAVALTQQTEADLTEVRALVQSAAFRASFDDTLDRLFGATTTAEGEI